MDHPRIHGEHIRITKINIRRLGSPPHTRGTQGGLNVYNDRYGITPAYTGNTLRKY